MSKSDRTVADMKKEVNDLMEVLKLLHDLVDDLPQDEAKAAAEAARSSSQQSSQYKGRMVKKPSNFMSPDEEDAMVLKHIAVFMSWLSDEERVSPMFAVKFAASLMITMFCGFSNDPVFDAHFRNYVKFVYDKLGEEMERNDGGQTCH